MADLRINNINYDLVNNQDFSFEIIPDLKPKKVFYNQQPEYQVVSEVEQNIQKQYSNFLNKSVREINSFLYKDVY